MHTLNNRKTVIGRTLLSVVVLFILLTYSYPALKTWKATGSRQIPPVHAPDISLYLNLSRLTSPSQGSVVNPFYGVDVPSNGAGHLQFRLSFSIFDAVSSLLGGQLWMSVLIWNLLWWGLLCGVAIALFEHFLPDNSICICVFGLSLLMLFNFGIVQSEVLAWLHPSWLRFEDLELPYIRPFFPQVSVPLLLAYLGLQISWQEKPRNSILIGMALLQLVAFGMFPYTTLVMAGITATVVIKEILSHPRSVPYISLCSYAIACGGADFAFLLHGSAAAGGGGEHPPIFRFDPTALHHTIGGMWWLLLLLTLAIAITRELPDHVRWPLIGLGLSCISLLTGDVFFSETLLVSHHGGYFAQGTVATLLTFLIAGLYLRKIQHRRWLRPIVWAMTALLAVNGAIIAEATFRRFLPYNQELIDLAKLPEIMPIKSDDLFIVRADTVDDACAWIPLISSARVLYCRNAGSMLAAAQYDTIQRYRQAVYLYFIGRDDQQLVAMLQPRGVMDPQSLRIAFPGVAPFKEEDRRGALEEAKTSLIPLLTNIEHHDPRTTNFFRNYKRIIVVESALRPIFDRERLNSFLTVDREKTLGGQVVLTCTAK